MERFELAETPEEREIFKERIISSLMESGKSRELAEVLYSSMLCISQPNDLKFGLENIFPNLSPEEEVKINDYFEKRKELLKKYQTLSEKLKPLLLEESALWNELLKLSLDICKLEGHRLSAKVEKYYEYDGYGRTQVYCVRTCLVCGKQLFECDMNEKDVVVKGNLDIPKRVLKLDKEEKRSDRK